MPGESYGKQLRSLLCLCDIFRALINSLVYWVIRVRFGCCFVVVVFNETRTTTRGRKEENEKERKENNKRKWEKKKRKKKRKERKKEKNSLCSTQVQGNKRNFYNRGFCVKMLGWFLSFTMQSSCVCGGGLWISTEIWPIFVYFSYVLNFSDEIANIKSVYAQS